MVDCLQVWTGQRPYLMLDAVMEVTKLIGTQDLIFAPRTENVDCDPLPGKRMRGHGRLKTWEKSA